MRLFSLCAGEPAISSFIFAEFWRSGFVQNYDAIDDVIKESDWWNLLLVSRPLRFRRLYVNNLPVAKVKLR